MASAEDCRFPAESSVSFGVPVEPEVRTTTAGAVSLRAWTSVRSVQRGGAFLSREELQRRGLSGECAVQGGQRLGDP
ncbi:hypothetical protein GCM10009771_19220 [Nesterenkonia flava]